MQHMNKLKSGSINSLAAVAGLPLAPLGYLGSINRVVHEQIYVKSFYDSFIQQYNQHTSLAD